MGTDGISSFADLVNGRKVPCRLGEQRVTGKEKVSLGLNWGFMRNLSTVRMLPTKAASQFGPRLKQKLSHQKPQMGSTLLYDSADFNKIQLLPLQ